MNSRAIVRIADGPDTIARWCERRSVSDKEICNENRTLKHRMSVMKKGVPKSVDEYIAAQPETMQPKLQQVRAAIKRAVPEALEGIGYGMPGYKLHGKPMLYFAGFKKHYSLFAASGTFFAGRSKMSSGAMTCERGRSMSHSPNPFR